MILLSIFSLSLSISLYRSLPLSPCCHSHFHEKIWELWYCRCYTRTKSNFPSEHCSVAELYLKRTVRKRGRERDDKKGREKGERKKWVKKIVVGQSRRWWPCHGHRENGSRERERERESKEMENSGKRDNVSLSNIIIATLSFSFSHSLLRSLSLSLTISLFRCLLFLLHFLKGGNSLSFIFSSASLIDWLRKNTSLSLSCLVLEHLFNMWIGKEMALDELNTSTTCSLSLYFLISFSLSSSFSHSPLLYFCFLHFLSWKFCFVTSRIQHCVLFVLKLFFHLIFSFWLEMRRQKN